MQLTLVVADLLDLPADVLASIDVEAPALSRLVASGGEPQSENDGVLASACRACGIARQQDWPAAPRLARAAGIDPGEAYWLCADPVALVAGANDVRLSAMVDDLSLRDAKELSEALNAHFAQEGIEFVVADAVRWFVRAQRAQRLSTRPPTAALGASLLEYLPRGDDGPRWRRWLNEAQMILFEHAVNERRARDGAAPANSVWLWGGGTDGPRIGASTRIFSDNPWIGELARGSASDVMPLPLDFAALAGSEPAVVWLDGLDAGAALARVDRAWTAPARRALDAGSLTLDLVLGGRAHALRFRARRSTLGERVRARFAAPRGAKLLLPELREPAAV